MHWYSIPAFVVKIRIVYCFAFLTGAAQCLPDLVGLHACAVSVTFLDFSCALKLFVNNSIVENKNKIEYFFMLFFFIKNLALDTSAKLLIYCFIFNLETI
jgi:hypothetical protein